MRELSYAEVRAAGLPARLELADATYEYRPLLDSVAVLSTHSHRLYAGATHRLPVEGWYHEDGCACSYCRAAGEVLR